MLLQLDEYIWSCDLISAMAANLFLMFKFKKIFQSLKAAKCVKAINTTYTHTHIFSTYHGSTHKSEVDSGIEFFDGVLQAGVSL